LLPGGNKKYAAVWVMSLPEGATAAGLRAGAANVLSDKGGGVSAGGGVGAGSAGGGGNAGDGDCDMDGDGAGDDIRGQDWRVQWGALSADTGVDSGPEVKLSEVNAEKLYTEATARGGLPKLKPGDKCRALLVCNWFDAMATKEEHTTLYARQRDDGACKVVVHRLHALMRVRLREAYTQAGKKWHRALLSNNDKKQAGRMKAGSFETHKGDLGKAGVVLDIATLREWRKAHEAPPLEDAPSQPAAKRPYSSMMSFFGGDGPS